MKPNNSRKAPGLHELGARISRIDRRLIAVLAKRVAIAKLVAQAKIRNSNQPILRIGIEEKRIEEFVAMARKHGVEPNFARAIYWLIINASCRMQIAEKEGWH